MEEVPGGPSFGRKASSRLPVTSVEHDGESFPPARQSMDSAGAANRQFARRDSVTVIPLQDMSYEGGVSHQRREDSHRTLTLEELATLDRERMRAEVLERLGISQPDLDLTSESGQRPEA